MAVARCSGMYRSDCQAERERERDMVQALSFAARKAPERATNQRPANAIGLFHCRRPIHASHLKNPIVSSQSHKHSPIDHAHASAARHGFSTLHLRPPRSLANSLAHFIVIPSSPRTLDFDRQMPSHCNRQLVRLAIPRLGRRQGLQDPRFQPLSE